MNKRENTALHLFDDPESQVQFLELSLGDNEWKTRIHIPPGHGDAGSVARQLRAQGLQVAREHDEDGHTILIVHHFGKTPDMLALLHDYGLIRGSGFVISNPLVSTKQLISGVREGLSQTKAYIADPARANGLIFLTAEMFLLRAAGGNKHGKWHHPKNLLQGLAASLFLSQSAAYLFWAKKGDDRLVSDYDRQLLHDDSQEFGKLREVPALNARPPENLLAHVRRGLEDHPIQTGAMLNNLGMLCYISHALLERRFRQGLLRLNPHDADALQYVNSGFWKGIAGSAVSIAGWSSLLVVPKEIDEPSRNPILAAWQKWRENPQMLAGGTSLLSSSLRLMEAHSKGNHYQAIGEGIYIPGDILLFFVKNHEYGMSTNQDMRALAEKISHVILARPMLLSPAAQSNLVTHTADYVMTQYEALASTPLGKENRVSMRAEFADALQAQCEKPLSQRFDVMIGAARRLIAQLPANAQPQAGEVLANTLTSMDEIHAEPKEMIEWLCAKPAQQPPPPSAISPDIASLAPAIGTLAKTIPGPHTAEHVLALRHALQSVLQPESSPPAKPHTQVSTAHLLAVAPAGTGRAEALR